MKHINIVGCGVNVLDHLTLNAITVLGHSELVLALVTNAEIEILSKYCLNIINIYFWCKIEENWCNIEANWCNIGDNWCNCKNNWCIKYIKCFIYLLFIFQYGKHYYFLITELLQI